MSPRSEQIKRHSENYGLKFCVEQGPFLASAVSDWRGGISSTADAISVRAYNSSANCVREVSLTQILEDIPLRNGRPLIPKSNSCGQVMLKPDLSISTSIYHTLIGAWFLTIDH